MKILSTQWTNYSIGLSLLVVLMLVISACQPADRVDPTSINNLTVEPTSIPVCITPTLSITAEQETEVTAAAVKPTEVNTAITECLDTKGRIEVDEIVSEYLPNPLKYRIYLPPCYSEQEQIRYPVLILLHGQGFNEDQWDRLGMDETADTLIRSGEAPPFIAVMPWEEYHLKAPRDSGYGNAIVSSLIPSVDRVYATCAERHCRAIGGISRGAAWAMRLGLENWQIFGAIGAHSFPPFGGDIFELPYWLQAIPTDQRPQIYIDIGVTDQYYEPAVSFEQQLTQLRVPHSWNSFPGTHEESYWQSHIEDYLLWYTHAWEDRTIIPE